MVIKTQNSIINNFYFICLKLQIHNIVKFILKYFYDKKIYLNSQIIPIPEKLTQPKFLIFTNNPI